MSAESQSEKIWQYAMRRDPVDVDAKDTSLNVINNRSAGGDTTMTDFSMELGTPAKLNFHGLAQTQTQSQAILLPHEPSMDGTESQKENLHFHAPGGSRSSLLASGPPTSSPLPSGNLLRPIGGAGTDTAASKAPSSSHVTAHVTVASPRAPDPIVAAKAPATAPSDSMPLMDRKEGATRTTPVAHKNRAVSFTSPTAPPRPPVVRADTMPPRPNRYAPRDIDRSSQDSFAGPLPPQDLNSFVRGSSILNNTYVRSGRDGRPAEVFGDVSSTSISEPVLAEELVSLSQSDLPRDGEPSTSQILQAAFDPRHSPAAAPSPVILVKDSQSQHSQSSDGGNSGGGGSGGSGGDGGGGSRGPSGGSGDGSAGNTDGHSTLPSRLRPPTPSSSSSVSFQLLTGEQAEGAQNDTQSTRPSTQSTQPNTQPTQTDPMQGTVILQSVGSYAGPSPLPVPAHRRMHMARLQAVRMGSGTDIVPETPLSTIAPSLHASAGVPGTPTIPNIPHVGAQADPMPKHLPPRSSDTRGAKEGKSKQMTLRGGEKSPKKPSSKGKGKEKQVDHPLPARTTRATAAAAGPTGVPPTSKGKSTAPPSKRRESPHSLESEVVPDSQEEQQQRKRRNVPTSPKPATTPTRRPYPSPSDIVPDSQEEEQREDPQAEAPTRPSSPAIPLAVLSRRGRKESLAPPTPTPAAVKPFLRRNELPETVTHTRGRTRTSSAKGKGKRRDMPVASGPDEEVADAETPMRGGDGMEVDVVEDEHLPKEQPLREKRPSAISKGKTVAVSKGSKKPTKQANRTRTPISAGPSTRSRKRKIDATQDDSPRESEAPLSTSMPPKKRRRASSTTVTPAPTALTELDTRVLARRINMKNFYLPGTVTVETVFSDPIPSSTVFTVKFDDGHVEDVDVEYMRQYELELHDLVHLTTRVKGKVKVYPAQVLDVERWDSVEIAEVHELEGGPDGDDYEVEGRLMRFSEENILGQWNERRVSTRTLLRDHQFDKPIPNEYLAGMGFIITLPDLPKSKRSIIKLIEASGGLIYDDWSAIVTLSGSFEVAGKRMTGKTPEVRMSKETRKAVPKILFCLTDEPRTTPKYLIALALGVPCLSIDWVVDRVAQANESQYVDWPAYVLPAGHNPVTRMAACQAFDRTWWHKGDNLPKVISQPPIFKPFAGKAFLCVGAPEFLFSKRDFGTFPKVLLAMGASYVQAVTDFDQVNPKEPHDFDYTVVDDGEALIPYKDTVSVNVSWLKKCLVTGIEGPIPWPDREIS